MRISPVICSTDKLGAVAGAAVPLAEGTRAFPDASGSFVFGLRPWPGAAPGRFSGPLAWPVGSSPDSLTGAGPYFGTCAVLGRGSKLHVRV